MADRDVENAAAFCARAHASLVVGGGPRSSLAAIGATFFGNTPRPRAPRPSNLGSWELDARDALGPATSAAGRRELGSQFFIGRAARRRLAPRRAPILGASPAVPSKP